jgi:hypothetical protein
MHVLGLALATLSALRMPGPLSPRNASYRIEATFDDQHKTVTAKEHITWRNITSGAANELAFHLYMNAFKNESSTFFRESQGLHRGNAAEPHGWGAIDVTRIVVADQDLTKQLRVDDTVGKLPLPAPIAAGATVEIDVEWKTTLPQVFARTGYKDDFFAVAQWFPKLGVFDCTASGCAWRAHQHHLNSEFFADYGVYDVTVDVPARFQVGATGVLINDAKSGNRRKLTYHAEDVHDFVFTACPRFRTYEDTFHDQLGDVRILLLDLPGHEANAPRHIAATKVGLAELTRRFGPYPYSQITVVDVPQDGEGAGGMEYPTLFFSIDAPVPRSFHVPELVTIHELSHQYFYGIVGSDEVEEAWLDEGLTETMTDWGLSRMFGQASSVHNAFGHHLSQTDESHIGYHTAADIDPMETRAFDYLTNGSYGVVTYAKTNLVLRTLEAFLGSERFERAMRHYYETWRFRHPRIDDFVHTFDEGAGEDLSWFWNPTLRTSEVLDYEVLSVESRALHPPSGLFDVDGGTRREVEPEAKPQAHPDYESEVVIHRKGEIIFPVELRVVFDDGTERRERWDGGRDGARWRRFLFPAKQRVVLAEIDPDHKVALDLRRWNDGRRLEPDPAPRRAVVGAFFAVVSDLLAAVGF